MCPSLNQSPWPESQPHWNWGGGWGVCPTHSRDCSGEQWSLEGKADSIPKRDAGLAKGTGVGEVVETGWGRGRGRGVGVSTYHESHKSCRRGRALRNC